MSESSVAAEGDAAVTSHGSLAAARADDGAAADAQEDTAETKRWFDAGYLEKRQTLLLQLLKSSVQVLESAGVPYWICGGTLIGAIRHGGFIPHDDDMDIECYTSDWDRIKLLFKAEPALTAEKVGHYRDGTQICRIFPVPYPLDLPGRQNCGIDIFLRPSELREESEYPSAAEVHPLRRFDFHGIEVYGPGQAEAYLERCYGTDWATTVHVWNHMFNFWTEKRHNPDRVVLSLEDYNALLTSLGYTPPTLESSKAAAREPDQAVTS